MWDLLRLWSYISFYNLILVECSDCFILEGRWPITTLTCTAHHTVTSSRLNSCCWTSLGFLLLKIEVCLVFAYLEERKMHLFEKWSDVRKWNPTKGCAPIIEKKRRVEHDFVVADLLLSCCTETCEPSSSIWSVWWDREPPNLLLVDSETVFGADKSDDWLLAPSARKHGGFLDEFCSRYFLNCWSFWPIWAMLWVQRWIISYEAWSFIRAFVMDCLWPTTLKLPFFSNCKAK